MSRMFKAELLKLRRRRVAIAMAGSARWRSPRSRRRSCSCRRATSATAPAGRGATVASLGRAGGATEAFSLGASGAGILVLVVCSSPTSRASSRRGPSARCSCASRAAFALLAGKMAALLVFAALVLARRRAPDRRGVGRDRSDPGRLDRARGSALDGLGAAAGDYARALVRRRGVGDRSAWRWPIVRALDPGRARHRDRRGRVRSSTCSQTAGAAAAPVVPRAAARGARGGRDRRVSRHPVAGPRRSTSRWPAPRRARVRAPRHHGVDACLCNA